VAVVILFYTGVQWTRDLG